MLKFENTYSKLPEKFYERIRPEKFDQPQLVCFNENLATELGVNFQNISNDELAQIFSGQTILPSSEPLAMAYAGFQFGHPVEQLGDGRAHLLGEVNGLDIQLKGSGRTRFSRRGDGRSALGPVLREYIVSESMHKLGVATTRSLCAVTTGESVDRQNGVEPGGILTRVASSHIRVGTFQYFAFRNDIDAIKTLLDYTIMRHYPELSDLDNYSLKSIELLKEFVNRQSDLIASWSAFGFIHGVMNTDNFSLGAITIDYGPCAFMDEFKFNKVFSSIDQNGRYSFFNQVPIAKWNILRFAECLLPLIDNDQDLAIKKIEFEVLGLFEMFEQKRLVRFARKLGIKDYQDSDEDLVISFLKYLESEELDFTLAFRNLPELYIGRALYYPQSAELNTFVEKWRDRVTSVDGLNSINPIYIPRNHQIQRAIDDAYTGSFDHLNRLLEVCLNPFVERSEYREFAQAPKPSERVYKTFCGT